MNFINAFIVIVICILPSIDRCLQRAKQSLLSKGIFLVATEVRGVREREWKLFFHWIRTRMLSIENSETSVRGINRNDNSYLMKKVIHKVI